MANAGGGLILKQDEVEEYGRVVRVLGNGRCEAMCSDGCKRVCYTGGSKAHKKVTVAAGDIILVELRERPEEHKCDVILKYMHADAALIAALPENTRLNEQGADNIKVCKETRFARSSRATSGPSIWLNDF